MKEAVSVDVFQTLHDLEQDALDGRHIQALMITRLHELVQIPIHILHGNVKLLGEWIQENVHCWYQMWVMRERSEEDNLP